MNWKDQTCENCVFRVGVECRRFPPQLETEVECMESMTTTAYPQVAYGKNPGDYYPACAEYAERIEVN